VERLLELAFVPTLPLGLELESLRQFAPGLELVDTLWSMNNWKLYTRYKRHLPAPRRDEVEDLVSALVLGGASDEELQGRLEAILLDTWEAEDWNAFIRNPKLLEGEVISEEQLDDWKRRLAETG